MPNTLALRQHQDVSIHRKQFKARPLDKKILEQPVGIGLKAHIPPTKPMDVHFASDNRIAAYAERQHSRERETEVSPPKLVYSVCQCFCSAVHLASEYADHYLVSSFN